LINNTQKRTNMDGKHLIYRFTLRFGFPIGETKNRMVFANKRNVFKLPMNVYGWSDNAMECYKFKQAWRLQDKKCNLARCRIIDITEVPILIMQRLYPIPEDMKLPDWVDFIDSQQVGLSRDGRILAFDYAS
jgi:hypothetical protein